MKNFLFVILGGIASFSLGAGMAAYQSNQVKEQITATAAKVVPTARLTVSDLAFKTAVQIAIPVKDYGDGTVGYSTGTASHIGNNVFLSARHVCVMMAQKVKPARAKDYKQIVYEVTDYELAEEPVDLCILKVKAPTPSVWPTLRLASEGTEVISQPLYIGGFSGGRTYSYRSGYAFVQEFLDMKENTEATNPTSPNNLNTYGIAVVLLPGGSGSAVLNAKGEIVGVAVIAGINMPVFWAVRDVEIRKFLAASKIYKAANP